MDWNGLGRIGVDCTAWELIEGIGVDWGGLERIGADQGGSGLHWIGMDMGGLHGIGVDWSGSRWSGTF